MTPVIVLAAALAATPPSPTPPPDVEVHGEVRARGELLRELDLNPDVLATSPPQGDGDRVLLRSRVSVSGKPVEDVKLFLQLQDSRTFGEETTTAAALGNVDAHQAWAEWSKIGGEGLALRVGRMELAYGDQRLLGAFGWDNVGRAFDAALVRVTPDESLVVDAFWARLHADPRAFPERAVGDDLAGVYGTWKTKPLTLDVYGLVLFDRGEERDLDGDGVEETFRFPEGGELLVLTPGVRADVRPLRALHLNAELAGQIGSRGALDVFAYALHASADYTLDVPAKPKLLVGWDRASGDSDPADNEWGTFENLFPTNHDKYGYMDLAGWKNLTDVHGGVTVAPLETVEVAALVHRLARVETADTFYRASGAPLRPLAAAATTEARDVGTELDLTATWKASPNFGFLLGASKLWSGAFLDDTAATGGAPNPFFGYLQATGSF